VTSSSSRRAEEADNNARSRHLPLAQGKIASAAPRRTSRRAARAAARSPPTGGRQRLHVLGHFKNQKDADSGDRFALQQLLLNFILEKQRASEGLGFV